MDAEPSVSPTPNYLKPCVSLDVHKGSTTASRLGPGGRVIETWTFPTTSSALTNLARNIATSAPVVLEASTSGKAAARVLKLEGCELHMAAPNLIPKPAVKTDKRDSIRLGQIFQSGSMPECYVPPPEIDYLRLIVRNRKDLAHKLNSVKNQVHALVTRNLLDAEMKEVAVWFGPGGLRRLVRLPLPSEERAHLARYLQQIELLAQQEESMQTELAQIGRDRKEVQLLMTVPGIHFYTAIGILAEIGDIHRFRTKQQLASYAGLVPRTDNSGERVSDGRPVKKGNMILKEFLCTAVNAMLKASQETAVARFYREKAKSRPAQKALVAAARKLSAEVWKILTFEVPYREEDTRLSDRKAKEMDRSASRTTHSVSPEDLDELANRVGNKAGILDRLQEETCTQVREGEDAG